MLREIQKILDVNSPCVKPPMNKRLFKSNQGILFLSDPSGTDLSLVFSSSPPSPRPVSDYYYKCLIYHIQASGSPQPIHFLKAHDVS